MKSDSTAFLIKTNNDVDEWMDSFYTDGRKADFRSHCQWAWQENERRHNAIESDLLEALGALLPALMSKSAMMDKYDWLAVEKANAAIAKARGES